MHEQFVEPSKKYADIIVPEGGYRPFRLRTGANMRMAKEMPSPTDVSSIYVCGDREYSGLKHVAFVRDGAKFPSQRPFFLGSRFLKETMPLKGSGCMVCDVSSGDTFDCRADAPDQIFGCVDANVFFVWTLVVGKAASVVG